ncbi:hypothetical protein TNCV_336851 [Trichonephila clavipes]|nr:hypothetical protein TNCV_336851 [Trichonephila clavipes]
MENKPLPEEAATSMTREYKIPNHLTNTRSKLTDREFITDNAAAISEASQTQAAYAALFQDRHYSIYPRRAKSVLDRPYGFAHSLAPTLQSKLSGRFLRITAQSEEEYRKLATYFRHEQIAFKSFMLKSERPLKLILRGLPTSTELEAVKKEIEPEGFKIHKMSRLKLNSKAKPQYR